jgi:lipopolysaccharide transport system permease protein
MLDMLAQAKPFFEAKELLFAWTGRNIRGRYQQSVLGWLWAILQPVATVAIFTIIFTRIVPVDTGDVPYIVFSYVALVPWTFLAASLTDMVNSIVQNMDLVKKIYFPREVLPTAAMIARLMDFGIATTLIVVLLVVYQAPFFPTGWLVLPFILIVQILLILGLGFLGASLNVFYRDVQSLLTLVIQLWFYASPIIYPVTLIPDKFKLFYFLNPMAGIITAYRDVIINGEMPGTYMIPSTIVTVFLFILGYLFFKKTEFKFADIV